MKKRFLATILCVLMLVPCFTWVTFAGEGDVSPWNKESVNVAPKGKTYQTSNWNDDSSARYINNGYIHSSWQFWRPGDEARGEGFEGIDNTRQWCGMSFNQYQTIDSVTIYGHKYPDWTGAYCGKCKAELTNDQFTKKYKEDGKTVESAKCNTCKTDVLITTDQRNNIKYTIEILIQGQWYEAGHGYNNDMVYEVDKNFKVVGGTGGDIASLTIKLDKIFPQYDSNGDVVVDANGDPIPTNWATTKNVRVVCSEYGANAIDHIWDNWWLVPLIHEVMIWGHQSVTTPKFDVPEGAEVVTDAALGGMAGATTSQTGQYPLLGNDRTFNTYWRARDYENQSFWIDFEGGYLVSDVRFNFGGVGSAFDGAVYNYDVYIMRNGQWQKLTSDTVTATSALWEADDWKIYSVGDERIEGVKLEFTSAKDINGDDIAPVVSDTSAPIINGEQCVFLSSYLNYHRASSTAQGNLACYGEAYCSSSFDYSNISDVSYINDGQVTDDAFSWYAQTFLKGTYCGVKLKDSEDVTKVVLYFNDEITQDKPEEHVMSFDVQVLVDGVYKTVASATSYDNDKKSPIVSIELDEAVRTNDVRIVYNSNGMVFPYLKELEVYSGDKVYSSFEGFVLDLSIRTLHGRFATTNLAEPSVVKRAKFMDLKSPIEFLVFTTKYDIQ